MRFSQNPISEAPLMYDYENFHDDGLSKNVLWGDYHVEKLRAVALIPAITAD